ncbi:MAG: nucleoside-triphosphatase [Spirochaetota bacterium]
MTGARRETPEPTLPNAPGRRTVVTGSIGSGKTTRVLEMLQTYRDAGLTVAGVVSLHLNADDAERESYRFRFLSTGEERTFARRSADPTPPSSRYRFDPEAFARAREELTRWQRGPDEAGGHIDVIVIDECGPLELRGEGLWEELRAAWMGFPGDVVVTVRDRLVDEFFDAFDAREAPDTGRAGACEVMRLPDRGTRSSSGT